MEFEDYCGVTKMDTKQRKKDRRIFVSKNREAFFFMKLRREALSKARIKRGVYQCYKCKRGYKLPSMEVDHRVAVINPLEAKHPPAIEYSFIVKRLYNPLNLQVLCKSCHAAKHWEEKQIK